MSTANVCEYGPGTMAYLDTFQGLVPCRVIKVAPIPCGLPGVFPADVTVRLTATRGSYGRGETLIRPARVVIPRPQVRRRKYSTRILDGYRWVAG